METSPFNQSLLDARGRREIADTREPRQGAEFPNLLVCAAKRWILGSAGHTGKSMDYCQIINSEMQVNRYAYPNGEAI